MKHFDFVCNAKTTVDGRVTDQSNQESVKIIIDVHDGLFPSFPQSLIQSK